MTTLSGSYLIERGKHRLLEPINDICIATDAISVAAHHHLKLPVPIDGHLAIECKQIPMNVRLPLSGPVQCALSGTLPKSIELYFHLLPPAPPQYSNTSGGFTGTMNSLYSATLVNLYERNKAFLTKYHGGKKPKEWGDFWRFVWVVRNSCAHGKLALYDTEVAPVEWRGLKYYPAPEDTTKARHVVIGGDLSFGDLLVLMVEMSEELDAIGAPI